MPAELPLLKVANAAAWRQWLSREGSTSQGVLLATIKKTAKVEDPATSLNYAQALDEALCYGWIDSAGRKDPQDPSIYLYRFTPRKPRSLWSARNVSYIARLENEGRLQPAGVAAVEAAKADGRWEKAYSGSGTAEMPEDFLNRVNEIPSARETFEGLNKGNKWKIYFTLVSLRTEKGREKAIERFVEMLAKGETPVPQKLNATATNEKTTVSKSKAIQKKRRASVPSETREEPEKPISKRRTRSGRPAPSYAE